MEAEYRLPGNWIADAARICIICHVHPDGDALGSSAALWWYLRKVCGMQETTVLLPDAPPESLLFILDGVEWLAGEPAAAELGRCDLLFCLDFNTLSRVEALEPACRAFSGRKVLIDHHENPQTAEFDLCFSRTDVSSACELLFGLLTADTPASALPIECGTALLTGMTTDTNNFANSVHPGTLSMTSALLEAGVDRDAILDRLYRRAREQRLRALGDILLNRMVITPEGASVIVISKEQYAAYGLLDGETEGFVNIPLELSCVRLSILAREEDGFFRVSLRSKAGVSARELAVGAFHGGGHEPAAGGRLFIPSDIPSAGCALEYILNAAARFLQQISANE